MTTVEKSYNKNLYTDLLNQKITDINAEAKGKSDIEIKKVIVKKLNWESTLEDTSSVINSKLISINEKQSTLLSNRSNDNYELSHRKKGEKLTKNQILFIKNLIDSKSVSQKEISLSYSISPSWLRNIKKLNWSSINITPLRNYEKPTTDEQMRIVDAIKQYYKESETDFTSADIQKHLLEKLDIAWSLRMIRKIMKSDLNLTFKKCLTRPNNVDLSRVKVLRSMFWVDFWGLLKYKTLILNIDEWIISRSTKSNYSWSIKGGNKEVKNSPFNGSLSIILAILSNWNWFLLVTDVTIDSSIFCHFMKKLEYWVFNSSIFGYEKALWIMDNWPSHKSKLTYKVLMSTDFKIHFLPAYSPDLAPVEVCFAYLKRKLWSLSKGKIVKLTNKSEQTVILQAMKTISVGVIKKWFSSFYETIKHYLNCL